MIRKFLKTILVVLSVLLAGPLWVMASGEAELRMDWPRASMRSVGIAPKPQEAREAIVQVYSARAFSWRGAFSVHTWIVTKAQNANRYRRHEVISWYLRRNGTSVVSKSLRAPDGRWFDSEPQVVFDLHGADAVKLIPEIEQAIQGYPYAGQYGIWPGPNSNTFTAYIARVVDGLDFEMPANAIGKDYLGTTDIVRPPSKTGMQWNLGGWLGFIWARDEGVELNILGLVWGIDWSSGAIKLPGVGSVFL